MIEGLYNMYMKDKFVSFDESMNRRMLQTEVKDLMGSDFSKRISECKPISLSHSRYERGRYHDQEAEYGLGSGALLQDWRRSKPPN